MKKIAIYIPTYDLKNYFYKIISNFFNYKNYEVNLFVYTVKLIDTKFWDKNINWQITQCNPSIKQGLTFKYLNQLLEDKDKYDLFIYTEDDILIQENVIDTFLAENQYLSDNEVIGALRYE